MFPSRIASVLGGGTGLQNNYSLSFDGSNDYVALSPTTVVDNLTIFTVAFWIKRNGYGSADRNIVFGKDNVLEVAIKDTSNVLALAVDNNYQNFGVELADATWTHIVMSFTGNGGSGNDTRKLYVDGSLTATNTSGTKSTTDSSGDPLSIGARKNASYHTPAKIDELALWNTTLSAGDISALYSAKGTANLNDDGNSANLQGWWRFEEGSGTSATDSSANSNTGTLTNGPSYSADVPS